MKPHLPPRKPHKSGHFMTGSRRWLELALPLGVIACLMVILVPLPPALLDVLLAANITVAVIVLLTTIQVKTPLEFSIFPTLLLATTLSRLVLNIATTRLILSRGAIDQHSAAGGVIQSFGEFVAGNQITVGVVIFAIIVVVQFVVITKGATRISEVAARFTLDGMPGRQMAIDADLNAGTIDGATAARRREQLQEQADFYGAMDGASKYVRGDAIAGILITVINLVGGLAMGLAGGMSLTQAVDVFTRLTIGDGLVSQVPGLLISLAAGILISRSTRATNLSSDFVSQLFSRPQVLLVSGAFLFALVFTRLPAIPLLVVGGACTFIAWQISVGRNESRPRVVPSGPEHAKSGSAEPDFSRFLSIDPVEIELGVQLISLARGGALLERITRARQTMADELGVVLPKVRVRDNLEMGPNEFQVRINQLPVIVGEVHLDRVLLVSRTQAAGSPGGIEALWHTGFGAWWVPCDSAATREREFLRLEPADVIVETLKQQTRLRAADILTRQSTAFLIDQLRESNPATVDELIPDVLRIGQVQQVLQMLLREGVSIKPLNTILEAVADQVNPGKTASTETLVDAARRRLAPWITGALRDPAGTVNVVELDRDLQLWLGGRAVVEEGRRRISIEATMLERMRQSLWSILQDQFNPTVPVGLIVPPPLRAVLHEALEMPHSRLRVIAADELARDARIETIAILELEEVQYVAA